MSRISSQMSGSSSTTKIPLATSVSLFPVLALGDFIELSCVIGRYRHREPLLQLFSQYLEINRFRNASVTTGRKNALLFSHHRVRRHSDHRNMGQRGMLANPPRNRQPVLISELNIKQHRVGRLFLDCCRSLRQIRSGHYLVAFRFQPVAKQFAVKLVILNDQNTVRHNFTAGAFFSTRCNCSLSCCCHDCCLWNSDSACFLRYCSSSTFRSLLVNTNTGRSAVRGFVRHSANSSNPLTFGSIKSRMTNSGKPAAI